jgi:hypothetical protein
MGLLEWKKQIAWNSRMSGNRSVISAFVDDVRHCTEYLTI